LLGLWASEGGSRGRLGLSEVRLRIRAVRGAVPAVSGADGDERHDERSADARYNDERSAVYMRDGDPVLFSWIEPGEHTMSPWSTLARLFGRRKEAAVPSNPDGLRPIAIIATGVPYARIRLADEQSHVIMGATADEHGRALFPALPWTLKRIYVSVQAEGRVTWGGRYDIPDTPERNADLFIGRPDQLLQPHQFVVVEERIRRHMPLLPDIYRVRGDFLGDFSDAPPGPGLMWGGMSSGDRAGFLAWYRQRGYTHLPLAVHNDYPRFPQWQWTWWEQPAMLHARLLELRQAGIVPILVLHPRPARPGVPVSIGEHLRDVSVIWPLVRDLVPMVMWNWEGNDLGGEWSNGTEQLRYLSGLHAIVGSVPILVHFTPERWSGWPGFDGTEQDKDEIAWLREAKARGVWALFYQEPHDKPIDEVVHRAVELPSPHGWRPGIAGRVVDGAGLAFIMAEYSRQEARGIEIGRRVMGYATVSGFLNGG